MPFFIIALAYFLTAKLGGLFAIPPDFASAVWPAAGIALSAFLLAPARIALPAVLLGAVCANLYRTTAGFSDLSLGPVLTGTIIAVGSTVQAWFGAWLYRRFLQEGQRWDDAVFVLKFCIIVALISCVVGASVGTLTLLANEFITSARVPFNLITWWAGDAIGVLLVTPLVQVLLASEHHFSRDRKIKTFVPLVLILIVVYGLFSKSVEHDEERSAASFQAEADHLANTIQSRLLIAENKLAAYAALFVASDFVSQKEFTLFSERMMVDDDAFQGVGWTKVLDHKSRLEWEAYFKKEGYPDYRITELGQDGTLVTAPVRDEYYPVLYIHPLEANRKAFGLNLAANPVRKEALLLAADKRIRVATAPITLVQEEEGQKAIIVYSPVFERDFPGVLIGYASGVLRVNGILGNSAQRAEEAGLRFSLYDIADGEAPLFEQEKMSHSTMAPLSYIEHFSEREYRLDIFPGDNYQFSENDWNSYVILTGGFVIAALFQLFALTTTGTIENVTRQVKAQTKELTEAVTNAKAASEAKSEFLANMSHELRTPLNAISGFIHLTLDSKLNDKQRDFLQKAGLASETLMGLINQTLDYAKIESGMLELDIGDVQIRHVARKMEALFGQTAKEKNIEFLIEVEQVVPNRLVGDQLRIEQVIINLLSNAFKFTSSGHVSVIFSYDNGKLIIRVTDTGTGIPFEKQQHIFSAFGQADASTSRQFGGTGLGLSISKRIANHMGGDIQVRSTVGEGSEFFVSLLIAESTQEGDAVIAVVDDTQHNLNGLKVLIVEDVMLNQILTQEILRKHGIETDIACNGLEAVEKVKSGDAIDMILMDIQMPVMDGFEATRQIRSINPDIPIVGMTANAMASDVAACLEAGMHSHVAKPVDPKLLLAAIIGAKASTKSV